MYKDLVDIKGNYNTPRYLFNYLNKHFKFELDPCATSNNHLDACIFWYPPKDGLKEEWEFNAFVNPPYGSVNENAWVDKALSEFNKYKKNIFLLLPAKTEVSWFSKLFTASSVIIFPQKRISFIKNNKKLNRNTMGSVIFGLINMYDGPFLSEGYNQMNNFLHENWDLNIPCITDTKCIFFPHRDVLEENYQ